MAIENQDPGSAGVPPAHGAPKGWYSRRYLPHCDTPGLIQAITFRLADALPKTVLQRLAALDNDAERRRAIEAGMDAGYGACYLPTPTAQTSSSNLCFTATAIVIVCSPGASCPTTFMS